MKILKWIISIVLVLTAPVWFIPFMIIGLFVVAVIDLHCGIWEKETKKKHRKEVKI